MPHATHPPPIGFAIVVCMGLVLFSWARPTLGVDVPTHTGSHAASSGTVVPPKPKPAPTPVTPDPASAASKPTPPQNGTPLPGIDVSHYQGTVDWAQVAKSGKLYAYVKATGGNTFKDPRYAANFAAAQKAGLKTGAYHFFIPGDDPIRQAEHFLSVVTIGPGTLPPALDLESVPKAKSDHDVGDAALKWLMHVEEKTGCKPVIYSNGSYFLDYLGKPVEGYPFWLAEYAKRARLPSGIAEWTFWQHSQTGRVNGITGHVDLDSFQGAAANLDALVCAGKP